MSSGESRPFCWGRVFSPTGLHVFPSFMAYELTYLTTFTIFIVTAKVRDTYKLQGVKWTLILHFLISVIRIYDIGKWIYRYR